jgi:DNA repair photolyase
MKRFAAHREPWGLFVDVKVNAAELLQSEIAKKPPRRVWVSGVCDPYQPLQKRYELTKKCLQILLRHGWPVTVQTKSPLVLRDTDILKSKDKLEVGFSVSTANEKIRNLFEPKAPPIEERIRALGQLHEAGIRTFAMVAPLLPGAEELAPSLSGKVDYVLIDRMNYHYADWVYRRYHLEGARNDEFFFETAHKLASALEKTGVECQVVF